MLKMVKRLHIIGLAVLAAMMVACGQRKNTSSAGEAVKSVPFPEVKIPNMITEPSERMTYVLDHFWDGMMSASLAGKCDSLHVKGILKDDVEQKFGLYATILWSAPPGEACKSVSKLFSAAEDYVWDDTKDYLWPIPVDQRTLTGGALTQNPGWEDSYGK